MTINKGKTLLSLLFMVTMIVVTIFMSFFVSENIKIMHDLDMMYTNTKKAEAQYLEKTIKEQHNLVKTINEMWKTDIEPLDASQEYKNRLFINGLKRLMNQAETNLVIAVNLDGELYFEGYRNDIYSDIYAKTDDLEPIMYGDLVILNDSLDAFGSGDRLYVSGTVLNTFAEVYVMFDEKVAYNSMSKALDKENIMSIYSRTEKANNLTYFFLVSVFVLGMVIIVVLKKMQVNIKNTACPYYGNKICRAFIEDVEEEL